MIVKKLIPIVLIVVGILSMWNIYNNVKISKNSAVVKAGEYVDIIKTDALVIRNEQAITVGSTGFFQNSVPNISKVEKGKAVGEFYEGTPDREAVGEINAVNEKIREVQTSTGSDTLFSGDISAIDSKLKEYSAKISALSAEGNQAEINKIRKEMDALIARKENIKTGTSGGKKAVIEALEAEKSQLEQKLGSNVKTLYSGTSGVFVASVDGLEGILKTDTASAMTVSGIEELLSRKVYEPSQDILPYPVAKVVDNSTWLIAVITEEDRVGKFEEIGRVNVKFFGGNTEEITCRYAGCTEAENGKVAIFLKGTQEIEYLLKNRKVSVEIYVDDYKGLKIPTSALKKHEGKDAVEVRSGKETVVKQVDVLFKNDEFAIVKADNTKDGALELREEVVIQ